LHLTLQDLIFAFPFDREIFLVGKHVFDLSVLESEVL